MQKNESKLLKIQRVYGNGYLRTQYVKCVPGASSRKNYSALSAEEKEKNKIIHRFSNRFNQFMSLAWNYDVTITAGKVTVTPDYKRFLMAHCEKNNALFVLKCADADGVINFNTDHEAFLALLRGFALRSAGNDGDFIFYLDYSDNDNAHYHDSSLTEIIGGVSHFHAHGVADFLFRNDVWAKLSGSTFSNGIWQRKRRYHFDESGSMSNEDFKDLWGWYRYANKRNDICADMIKDITGKKVRTLICSHNKLKPQTKCRPKWLPTEQISEEDKEVCKSQKQDSRLKRRGTTVYKPALNEGEAEKTEEEFIFFNHTVYTAYIYIHIIFKFILIPRKIKQYSLLRIESPYDFGEKLPNELQYCHSPPFIRPP